MWKIKQRLFGMSDSAANFLVAETYLIKCGTECEQSLLKVKANKGYQILSTDKAQNSCTENCICTHSVNSFRWMLHTLYLYSENLSTIYFNIIGKHKLRHVLDVQI